MATIVRLRTAVAGWTTRAAGAMTGLANTRSSVATTIRTVRWTG